MMRKKNNILLNMFAIQVTMNHHLFTYPVEIAVPPKLDDWHFFFSVTDTTFSTKKKKQNLPIFKLLYDRSK